MDAVVSSERQFNNGDRAGIYIRGVQDREAAVASILVLAAGDQVAIPLGRVCRPRDEAWLADRGVLAGLPDLGHARCDVGVSDALEAHGPKGAPEGVVIWLPCVAVIAAG